MIIKKIRKPEWYTGDAEVVRQREKNKKDKEIAENLEKKQLPKGKEVKAKRNFYLYVGDTVLNVWFNGHDYRFINLSNNKISWISQGEEKILGREGEILVDKTDTQASRKHLKLKVDNDGNLFLCDNSKHGTFVDEVRNSEKKKKSIKCEKITLEEIEKIRNSKKTREAEYLYEEERYKPENKIDLGNGIILYTTNRISKIEDKLFGYGFGGYHEWVVGYIKFGEEYQLRMFYKSRSEGVRRACPGERTDGGYSKGENLENYSYDTTSKVVPNLVNVFENLEINKVLKRNEKDPIEKSTELGDLLLEDDMKNEIMVNSLFNSSELMDYLIYRIGTLSLNNKMTEIDKTKISKLIKYYQKLKDSGSVLSSAGKIMHTELKGNKKSIPFNVTKGIFDKLVPSGLNYKDMYKIEGENYKYDHIDFGEINVNVFETTRNGKKIKIHFGYAKNNHPEKIWIDNITYSDDEVSNFGTYKNPINAAPLVGKPADYEEQSPSFGDRRMDYKLPSGNMDVRDIYQDNPIIIHYKKLEGLL